MLFALLPQAGAGLAIGNSGGRTADWLLEVRTSGDPAMGFAATTCNREIDLLEGMLFPRNNLPDLPRNGAEIPSHDFIDSQSAETTRSMSIRKSFPKITSESSLRFENSGKKPVATHEKTDSQRIIWDSDYGPDVDDAVAHALLHGLVNLGECRIIAGIVCIGNAKSPGAMNAFDTWHGRGDIPVGGSDTGSLFPNGGAGNESDGDAWAAALYDAVSIYPRSITKSNYPTALSVYRKALAGSPDGSVKIITVGMLNTLSQLLDSAGDNIDARTGAELLKDKVSAVHIMGGRNSGNEFNMRHASTSAANVAGNLPVPIYWSQAEVGASIHTGKWTGRQHGGHILRFCMEAFSHVPGADGKGRQSWDPMNVLVAIRGEAAGFSFSQGTMTIDPSDGDNTWTPGAGPHYRVKKTLSDSAYEEVIEKLLFHPKS